MGPEEPVGNVRIERTFRFPIQAVFAAWTNVEVLKSWWHAEHSWETPTAELDPRVGGVIRVTMRDPETDTFYGGAGEYTAIDPPRRLAFTWTWDDDREQAPQMIEVEFLESGDHTIVVLTNRGIPEQHLDSHRTGWENSFDNLDAALER